MSDFLNWELTNKMHNLGYNGGTLMYIDDEEDIINDDTEELIGGKNEFWKPAILTSSAFRWFREKYELHSTITSISQESWQWHITKPGESLGKLYDEDFYTYEEAELACLEKLIEIIESKKE